jgi:hypothetical protein
MGHSLQVNANRSPYLSEHSSPANLCVLSGSPNRNTSDGGTMTTLTGWKEISTFLRRGVRTVQRWESLGLPIRRIKGGRSGPVFAFAEELEAWEKATPTRFLDLIVDLKARVESLEITITSLKQQLNNEKGQSSLHNQSAARTSRGADRARSLHSAIHRVRTVSSAPERVAEK